MNLAALNDDSFIFLTQPAHKSNLNKGKWRLRKLRSAIMVWSSNSTRSVEPNEDQCRCRSKHSSSAQTIVEIKHCPMAQLEEQASSWHPRRWHFGVTLKAIINSVTFLFRCVARSEREGRYDARVEQNQAQTGRRRREVEPFPCRRPISL